MNQYPKKSLIVSLATLAQIEEGKCDIRKLSYVTRTYREWYGVRVAVFAFVLEIPRVCQLSKEARGSTPSLSCAHNGARMLSGAAKTTGDPGHPHN